MRPQGQGLEQGPDDRQWRILQVSTVSGTLARFIEPIARTMADRGFVSDAAASGARSQPLRMEGFDSCFELDWSRRLVDVWKMRRAARRLRTIVDNNDYDIVHVHTPIAAFITRFVLRDRERLKVVYTAHGFHFYQGAPPVSGSAYRLLERVAARWTDHLIVMNREDEVAAIRLGLADSSTMTFMQGTGIDLDEFRPPPDAEQVRSAVRSDLGIPPDAYVLLMISHFTPNKRHSDAIQALSLLDDSMNAHLLIAGEGRELQACRALADRLGVADRVRFLGYRNDVVRLLTAADVFLLISDREGLPRSVMEAMALGCTVIGTDIRGTADLLAGDAGILVQSRDPAGLASAIVGSETYEPNADAVADILARCDLRRIVEQHAQVYLDLLVQPISAEFEPE